MSNKRQCDAGAFCEVCSVCGNTDKAIEVCSCDEALHLRAALLAIDAIAMRCDGETYNRICKIAYKALKLEPLE
jgi:hypothetical protein